MGDQGREQKISQLRVTDVQGQPLAAPGQYPSKYLPPSQYAVPKSLYAGAPVNIGIAPDEQQALRAILAGGIGAPHEPTRQDMLLNQILEYVQGIQQRHRAQQP